MGCGSTKEKLQTEMLVLQLEKAEIEEERERLINQLKLISNKSEYKKYILNKNNNNNIIGKESVKTNTDSNSQKNDNNNNDL